MVIIFIKCQSVRGKEGDNEGAAECAVILTKAQRNRPRLSTWKWCGCLRDLIFTFVPICDTKERQYLRDLFTANINFRVFRRGTFTQSIKEWQEGGEQRKWDRDNGVACLCGNVFTGIKFHVPVSMEPEPPRNTSPIVKEARCHPEPDSNNRRGVMLKANDQIRKSSPLSALIFESS